MTLDEAYRHIKASYIHHSQERNSVLLPQAELIAMECIEKCKQADVQEIMKAIDSQLQEVIDGTIEDNKKETDSETRRYGEGFCAGIELAQRYIRNIVDTED